MARLYCFDFDDNVARTDARIWTALGPVSTAAFALDKSAPLADGAFREFEGPHLDACRLEPCEHLPALVEALRLGEPVAVVTARAHDPADFRRLLERAARLGGAELHERVHLYCCGWSQWALGGETRGERKRAAVLDFLAQYPDAVAFGFSDDDPDNVAAVRALFPELAQQRPRLKLRLYPSGAAAQC